ncbi:hypothetical protein RB195_004235 [Necator americanus]|uniref:Uncharacterized protein n=1 Tax=Necator americanus TaxID=51031 RepID=A0ABR1BJ11_NECAM
MCISDLRKKLQERTHGTQRDSEKIRTPPYDVPDKMPPSTSLFPVCCCAKNVKRPKNEPPKTDLAIAVKTKQQLVIPKVALNGKIISSVKRKSGTALDHVVIDMNEEFVTARTSRDQLSSHYLSMNELMRVVRIEEGLNVTPRDLHHLRQQPSTSKPISVDYYNINTTPALRQKPLALELVPSNLMPSNQNDVAKMMKNVQLTSIKQANDAWKCSQSSLLRLHHMFSGTSHNGNNKKKRVMNVRQLACKERATRAVFNADGDITARMTNASSPRTGGRSACSVATISGNQNLTLPQPPPPQTYASYMSYVPQMLLAMITISFAWLANLITYVYR